jgi:hypothetical protein
MVCDSLSERFILYLSSSAHLPREVLDFRELGPRAALNRRSED